MPFGFHGCFRNGKSECLVPLPKPELKEIDLKKETLLIPDSEEAREKS